MNNKRNGSIFEYELCNLLRDKGYWSHILQNNKNGQPCDLVISKNNIPILIDCKDCKNNRFALSRMEENQINAMTLWKKLGNRHAYFALKLKDSTIRMIEFDYLYKLQRMGIKSLDLDGIIQSSKSFEDWRVTIESNYQQ